MSGAENPMSTSRGETGGFGVALFVSKQLLAQVPDAAAVPASVATLAARSNMAVEHTRRHLTHLVNRGLVVTTKNGGPTRYHRPEEGHMPTLASGTDRVLAMLPRVEDADEGDHVDGMTVREIAAHFDVDHQTIAPSVSYLHGQGKIARHGKGGAKDPFRYYVARPQRIATVASTRTDERTPDTTLEGIEDDADAMGDGFGMATGAACEDDVEYPPEDVMRARAIAEETGAMDTADDLLERFSEPVEVDPLAKFSIDAAEKKCAAESRQIQAEIVADIMDEDGAAEVAHCYAIVFADIKTRAEIAAADAATLEAVAVVLARILDEDDAP